jgi:hypothetical protein
MLAYRVEINPDQVLSAWDASSVSFGESGPEISGFQLTGPVAPDIKAFAH